MWEFFRVRKGRSAAIAAIAPFVENSRRRLDGIPEEVWLNPYMVGFMGMLITLVARHETGPLNAQAMGLIQSEAWARITGLSGDLVGEEICFLSSSESRDFGTGCRNAAAFLDALTGAPIRDVPDDWGLAVPDPLQSGDGFGSGMNEPSSAALAMWSLYFDEPVAHARRRSSVTHDM